MLLYKSEFRLSCFLFNSSWLCFAQYYFELFDDNLQSYSLFSSVFFYYLKKAF